MTSDDWMLWNTQPLPSERKSLRGEPLFSFFRVSDQSTMTCELRFHGESYGWEAMFCNDGELFIGCGGFATRAEALAWAREEHAVQCAAGHWSTAVSTD